MRGNATAIWRRASGTNHIHIMYGVEHRRLSHLAHEANKHEAFRSVSQRFALARIAHSALQIGKKRGHLASTVNLQFYQPIHNPTCASTQILGPSAVNRDTPCEGSSSVYQEEAGEEEGERSNMGKGKGLKEARGQNEARIGERSDFSSVLHTTHSSCNKRIPACTYPCPMRMQCISGHRLSDHASRKTPREREKEFGLANIRPS